MFVDDDPLGNPVDQPPPVEPDDDPQAAEARLRRQVHLGHVAALVRQAHRRAPGPGHRRRPDRPALGHGAGGPGGHRLHQGDRPQRQDLPAQDGAQPEVEFEWKIPQVEQRHRARPGPHLLPGLRGGPRAATSPSKALEELHAGQDQDLERFKVPDEAIGCGFHEAVRGVLSHHVVIRDGKIANYHPYPPTPWNASPRDIYGTPGPYEDAVQNTPIFEENGPDKFKGIDIMRAVRSFDPCLPCGVHMYLGNGRVVEGGSLPDPPQHAASVSHWRRSLQAVGGSFPGRCPPEETDGPDATTQSPRSQVRGSSISSRSCAPRPIPPCWPKSRDLVHLLVEVYGAGLGRIIELIVADDHAGRKLLDRLVADELVASLLVLHDLHPSNTETRVREALEHVRPYLGSHAGDVEFLGIDRPVSSTPGFKAAAMAVHPRASR